MKSLVFLVKKNERKREREREREKFKICIICIFNWCPSWIFDDRFQKGKSTQQPNMLEISVFLMKEKLKTNKQANKKDYDEMFDILFSAFHTVLFFLTKK